MASIIILILLLSYCKVKTLKIDNRAEQVTDDDIKLARESVLEAHLAAVEHRPLPKSIQQGWISWSVNLPLRVFETLSNPVKSYFFKRRDHLRENIIDERARQNYDEMRLEYVTLVKEKNPNDPIIEAIIMGNNGDLQTILKEGIDEPSKLSLYFDTAIMMPNEAAISQLIGELEEPSTHSLPLLFRMEPIEFIILIINLITPHVHPGHFKRIFKAHPPEEPIKFLRDILEQMIQSSPEVFITYLAASYQLAIMERQTIRPIIEEYQVRLNNSIYPPHNVAMATLFIYLEAQKANKFNEKAKEILEAYPVMDGDLNFLRGLNSLVENTTTLTKIATGTLKGHHIRRVEYIVELALNLDPGMNLVVKESLIGLLDLYRIVTLLWGRDDGGGGLGKVYISKYQKLCKVIEQGFYKIRMARVFDLSLPVLGFALRTNIIPPETVHTDSWSLWNRLDPFQVAMLNSLKYMKSLSFGNLTPCAANPQGTFKVIHIAVDHVLPMELFQEISFNNSQSLVYNFLAFIFKLPASSFNCDRPLGHYSPIHHLNMRLKCYCGFSWPLVFFTKLPNGGNRFVWKETEKFQVIQSKRITKAIDKSQRMTIEKRGRNMEQPTSPPFPLNGRDSPPKGKSSKSFSNKKRFEPSKKSFSSKKRSEPSKESTKCKGKSAQKTKTCKKSTRRKS